MCARLNRHNRPKVRAAPTAEALAAVAAKVDKFRALETLVLSNVSDVLCVSGLQGAATGMPC